MLSASLRFCTSSRLFSSSSAWVSASFTMLLISSSDRPELAVMVMRCSLPVPVSLAETFVMPLASMSKVTSIWGSPLGAGSKPSRINRPMLLFSPAMLRSPCTTCTSTLGWLSAAVVNVSLLDVGMVVLRGISVVATPPIVSIPRLRGVTSSSSRSCTSPCSTPAWMAAPIATTSSGFTPW